MSKPTLVYLIMAVLLVTGLYAILRLGRDVHAPTDLAGEWQVDAAPNATEPAGTMAISQSGQFFVIRLPGAEPINLKLVSETHDDAAKSASLEMAADNLRIDATKLPTDPANELDHFQFAVHGPAHEETFSAHRTVQTYAGGKSDSHGGGGAKDGPTVVFSVALLVMQAGLILALSRLMGVLFAKLHQPQVMGEMLAGIMLGPSLLGWVAPGALAMMFPPSSVVFLNALSQVGVIFFLFLIGLELDPKLVRSRGHAAVVISHVSIVAPFLLGAGLTLFLFSRLFNAAPNMRFLPAALFMGAAMSITAFPVLARILTERNLHKTKVGAVAITCAAVDDITAWCLLAFVVGVAQSKGIQSGMLTAGLSVIYVIVMLFLVRPLLGRLQAVYERQGRLSQNMVGVILFLTLASAYTTEQIGIHALFGAFLMGAIMPKGTTFVRHLSEKLEDFTVVFLLPIFFAYTGLRTRIGLLNNVELWILALVVIGVACLGKFGGSTLAARACGIEWRESSAIGILMNTRGLMELVILNIGRELGVITDAVFAIMVIMALVTTALTTPILAWIYPTRLFGAKGTPDVAPIQPKQPTILIPVANPTTAGSLLKLAQTLGADAKLPPRIYALNLRRPVDYEAYRVSVDDVEPTVAALSAIRDRPQTEPVQTLSFVSRNVAEDIVRVGQAMAANLILMGFHKPVFSKAILGGTVRQVLAAAPIDVAVFVDRGFAGGKRILVPYLGGPHDQLALELAHRMARTVEATVTVLHVVPPNRNSDTITLGAKTAMDRVFQDPSSPTPVTFRVVPDASPVDAVLHEVNQFDLVIIGMGEEWGLESQRFGFRAERIAQLSTTSLLIVRRHPNHQP